MFESWVGKKELCSSGLRDGFDRGLAQMPLKIQNQKQNKNIKNEK